MRNVLKATSISIRFLNEGITVNQTNFMQDGIILPLFFKSFLGNRENTKKGVRIKEVIEDEIKTFKDTGKPFGMRPPSWLEWNEEENRYDIDPDKAKVVLRIFDMINKGMGCRTVARIFNDEHVPTISNYTHKRKNLPPHKWGCTYIRRIIQNRAVMGYNPKFSNERPLYPIITGMTEKLMLSAQNKLLERKAKKWAGRGDDGRYLFTRIARCANPECKKSIRIRPGRLKPNKTNNDLPFRPMYCRGRLEGSCVVKGMIDYHRFEESFFVLMCEPKFRNAIVSKVYNNDETDPTIVIVGRLNDARARLEKYNLLLEKTPSDSLAEIVAKTEKEVKQLVSELERVKMTTIGTTETGEAYEQWNELVKDGWNKPETRFQIREVIRSLVDSISVDLKGKSYDVFFKANPDKPVHVKLWKEGFRVEGDVKANFFWQSTMPTTKQVEEMAGKAFPMTAELLKQTLTK